VKPALQAGLEHRLRYRVPPSKTVPALYPEAAEFQQMPSVFATGFLVGLLEWACMQAVQPHLDAPNELTVGTHIDVSHSAATPPGLEVLVHVRLLQVDGRRLVFAVHAHDAVDTISRGVHERFIVRRAAFEHKVGAKAAGSIALAHPGVDDHG
jgi:fluoroacetyl-CoA thioesterase